MDLVSAEELFPDSKNWYLSSLFQTKSVQNFEDDIQRQYSASGKLRKCVGLYNLKDLALSYQ